jgi:hypothetical protein
LRPPKCPRRRKRREVLKLEIGRGDQGKAAKSRAKMRRYICIFFGMITLVCTSSAGATRTCFAASHVRPSVVGAASCPQVRLGSIALTAKSKSGGSKKSEPSSGGFGTKTTTKTSTVDAAALLARSIKLYDDLSKEQAMLESMYDLEDEDANEPGLREYVVCVRSKAYDAVSDWVPSAVMGVMWAGGGTEGNPLLKGMANHNLFAPIAAKLHCREVWESTCQAAPSLRKLPRNAIEYAFEPLDGFGAVIEEVDKKGGSTAAAYKALGLEKGATADEIKSAHRKLIVKLHPDRVSSLPAEEQVKEAERRERQRQRKDTHTHTHTHTQRERERQRERETILPLPRALSIHSSACASTCIIGTTLPSRALLHIPTHRIMQRKNEKS